MGKLSISVPDDVEQALRERAEAGGTTVSAILTHAARRELCRAEALALTTELLKEIEDEQGPLSAEQLASVDHDIEQLREFFGTPARSEAS